MKSFFLGKFTHKIQTFSDDNFTSFGSCFNELSSLNISQIPKIGRVTLLLMSGVVRIFS